MRPATASSAAPDPLLEQQIAAVLKDGVTLMPLQREAVEWIVKNPRCIYADDMGLGKTMVALVSIGVLAQRHRTGHFRILLGLFNKGLIHNWLGEIEKFIRPGFFETQVLGSNDEPLVEAERLIVFTTYARLRMAFCDSLQFLPADCIAPATKRGARSKACAEVAPGAGPASDSPEEEAEEDQSLLDALLAEHGLTQVEPRTGARAHGARESNEAPSAKRKRTVGAASQYIYEHKLGRLEHRRDLFSNRAYWTDARVDAQSLLPCAPLLSGSNDSHPPLFSVTWDAIVFDEGHELKDIGALQTKAALFLAYRVAMLWQTGTPIQNRLLDALSALLMARDPLVACELDTMRAGDGTVLRGEAALEARVLRSLQRLTFRRSTADLLVTAPDVIASDSRTSYMVNTRIKRGIYSKFFQSKYERDLHNRYVQMLRNVAERLVLKKEGLFSRFAHKRKQPDGGDQTDDDEGGGEGGDGASLLKAYTRALQVCAAAVVIDDESEAIPDREEFGTKSTKMRMLMDVITNEIPKGEKIIVFDHRVKVLRVVARMLLNSGINSVIYASEIAEGVRKNCLELWRKADSGTDILLAQTKIAGTGHTWTEAHYVIHLTAPFNPAVEDQANFRAWRVGQTSDVIVYILIVAGSVEELALESQERKRTDNKAYMSGAEVATKAKERIKLDPEEVLRHANAILGGAGDDAPAAAGTRSGTGMRGMPAYREVHTFAEASNLDHLRKLFHGPSWITEEMMASGRIFFLDPARSYSDANYLPRGSLIMSVSSSAHNIARELSHCAERARLRSAVANPTPAALTGRGKKAKTGTAALAPEVRPMRVALCPVSLYVLLFDEFYSELDRLGRLYIEKRNAHVRAVGANHQRPLATAHNNQFFPACAPPRVNPQSLVDPDRLGDAYTALTKLLGNAALRHQAPYDLENLNTPAEVASALREFFQPQFAVLRSANSALLRSKHLNDAYHCRTRPNGYIELKGHVAALLTDRAPQSGTGLRTFQAFALDVDVLLSFAPLWHQPGYQLAERLANPAKPRTNGPAVDLYDPANEARRKQLHWVDSSRFGADKLDQEVLLFNRGDFAPATLRDVLLPLILEAATPGCSAHVRAMATTALCTYALSGCELTKIYLVACGDKDKNGAGAIQGLFAAVRVDRSTLIGAGIYLRSPTDDSTRQVFASTVVGRLLRDNNITQLVNAQSLLTPMMYDRSWCRVGRKPGQPATYSNATSCVAWGHYASGYDSFQRETPAPAVSPDITNV